MTAALLSGFFVGAIYGLIAVGLVVVYRSSRVVNFAHGDMGMVAAFLFSTMWTNGSVPRLVALAVATAVAAGLGALTELVVVRPLREHSPLNAMVATLGVSGLLLAFAIDRYGIDIHFTQPIVAGLGPTLGGLKIQYVQLAILGTAIAILAALWAMDRFTPLGLRLRAIAQDPYAAGQTGINVTATSVTTWAVAGAISGVSAILISSFVPLHVFFMTPLLLRGLVAALVGGLTNLNGAFAAGVAIGILEGGFTYVTDVPGLMEFALAVIVIVFLVARPSGAMQADY